MQFNMQASPLEKSRADARSDLLLMQIKSMTPTQAALWVETNVTTLAQAKIALKVFAKMLVILAKDI